MMVIVNIIINVIIIIIIDVYQNWIFLHVAMFEICLNYKKYR